MKILFWNTHKNKEINPVLCDLIVENNISLIVLAEYAGNTQDLISRVSTAGKHIHSYLTTGCDKLHILGSISKVAQGPQSARASMQIINDTDILCCVHLQSQAYPDHEERRKIAIRRLITDIRSLEIELSTKNTIVVGDFNVNPYDLSCVGAPYFHSLPVHADSTRIKRTVADEEHYMFYNPMWNFFGDFTAPYGTYYYQGSTTANTYWNIYDQVIIRPELKDRFVDSSLQIITETNSTSLLDSHGRPDDTKYSDHLPIMFEIREE